MKKLTRELLKDRRAHLGRRKFLIKLPLITAFALAAQTKPLFADCVQEVQVNYDPI
jgi:hypothetical protein